MKLYTEEQMKDAILEFFLSTYPTNGNDILSKYKPIELPSDEEIEEYSIDTYAKNGTAYYVREGAKWVIEQIKQQDNE